MQARPTVAPVGANWFRPSNSPDRPGTLRPVAGSMVRAVTKAVGTNEPAYPFSLERRRLTNALLGVDDAQEMPEFWPHDRCAQRAHGGNERRAVRGPRRAKVVGNLVQHNQFP